MNQEPAHKNTEISVAPMMDWTDRHCRFFHRLLNPRAKLYTEMVTTGALLHGDVDRHLRYSAAEHPIALQLGGSEPKALALCARLGEAAGYDEINLNCGCPSDRVQNGRFGACLMQEPAHVGALVSAMVSATRTPITVKCRIGVDDQDDLDFLLRFVDNLVDHGCKTLIIHARKAWLKGLSPKENRQKPPLDYDRAFAIKSRYPALRVILNGGLTTREAVLTQIARFDGVMIGREAYQNPYLLAELAQDLHNTPLPDRGDIARQMMHYAAEQAQKYNTPVKSVTRHILGLYQGQRGAKAWKRALSTLPYTDHAGPEVIETALEAQQKAERSLSSSLSSH